MIKAQYSAAEAQVKIGEAATGIGRGMEDTGMAIQRAKDKTEELQARASAIDELTASGALEDIGDNRTQLDRELAQISATSQVDDELAKLKAEVGPGDAGEGDRARARSRSGSRQRPLRPQEAEGAGARPAVRADDGRGHARRRVRAQAGGRRRGRLQAAVGRRVHAGRRTTSSSCCRASRPARARSSTARRTRSASSG